MIYAFIRERLARDYPVRACCRALGVSPSGYYYARSRGPSGRDCRRAVLAEAVRVAHADIRGVYGSSRVAHHLRSRGVAICRNTAAKLMRGQGLRSRRSRRFRPRTTDSSATLRPAPNRLNRVFQAARPDAVWLADITYIPLEEDFAYLAVVLDLHSRAVIGWAIDTAMPAALACEALHAAIASRRPSPGAICHSDRGVQYDNQPCRALLARHGLVQSMSRKGDCYDNAPMESFFSTLKSELIGDARSADLQHARDQLTAYIDGFYNRRRIHSALDYSTPHAVLQSTL